MKLHHRLLVWLLIFGFGIGLAGLALAWTAGEVRRIEDPETALREAWQRARSRGGYRFNANLEQTSIPLALPENVGRQSKSQSVFLEPV